MIEIIPNWHPVFVHYTVALLTVAGVLFILSGLARNWQYRQTAYRVASWNFWIGSGITIVTASMGWYAYNTVAHDTLSHAAMTVHRNWALGTLTLLAILGVWLWRTSRQGITESSYSFLVAIMLLLGLLTSTAWHGGELVYRHGLGVMSLPKSEGEAHAHGHAADQEHGHGLQNEQTQEQNHPHHKGEHSH